MNHANASTEIETGDSNFKLAAIIIIVLTIIASLGTFLLMVIPQEKQTFETTGYEKPEEPEDEDETANLSRKPASAKLEGSEAEIEVQKKAAFILTHGQMPMANIGKSFDWKVNYRTTKISNHFNHLSTSEKLSMIITPQITGATPLSEDILKTLDPKTCTVIFLTSDCSKVNLSAFRGKVGVINQDSQTIANAYANYFGQANYLTSQTGTCPKVAFDANLKKYIYNNSSCSSATNSNNHYYFYIYSQKPYGNYHYVYVAGAAYARTGYSSASRMELFDDLDATGKSKRLAKPTYFTINKDNYDNYSHYLMTFEKQNDNYIFKSFAAVDDN